MVTHRDKKPYECSYQDCDKSYCDMRSLRRHLENHHTSGQGGSGGSRTSSPALAATDSTDTISTANVVNDAENGRIVLKPSRGRPPKDRGLKQEVHDAVLEHLRSSECESGKSSGTSTPGSTHDTAYVRDQTKIVLSRERNSDSFSSTCSEDVAHVPTDKGTEAKQTASAIEETKPHTAIDMLKQAAVRVQEHREKQSAVEHYPPQQYVMYPEGISYPQWYQAPVFAGQDPRFGMYTYQQMFATQQVYHGHPINIQRQQLATRLYAEADKHSEIVQQQQQQGPTGSHPSKGTTQQSPSVEKPTPCSTQDKFIQHQSVQSTAAGTPTDPTAIAIATAKEKGQHLYTREGYYGVHPSGTQWQQVS